MKKQTYIQPAVEVIDVELDSMLCSSLNADMNEADEKAPQSEVEFRSTGNRWGSMFDPTEE